MRASRLWPTSVPIPCLVPGVSSRRATHGDFDETFRIMRAALGWQMAVRHGRSEYAQYRAHAKSFDPNRTLMILRNGAPVGVYRVDVGPIGWDLNVIALEPSAQRHGIGTSFIKTTQFLAYVLDVEIRLVVLVGNPARALYERLGFVVEHPCWLPLPFMRAHQLELEKRNTYMVWKSSNPA